MSSRLAKTNTGKAISWRSKVSLNKKVSCSMSCKCYLISKRLLKRNNSRVVSLSEQENNIYTFVPPHLVVFFLYVYFLLKRQMIGFNFAHEFLWTTWFKTTEGLCQNKSMLIILLSQRENHTVWSKFGKARSILLAGPTWTDFLRVVQLYWNWMSCFIELKYNICSQL